jgi:hypothetical protein
MIICDRASRQPENKQREPIIWAARGVCPSERVFLIYLRRRRLRQREGSEKAKRTNLRAQSAHTWPCITLAHTYSVAVCELSTVRYKVKPRRAHRRAYSLTHSHSRTRSLCMCALSHVIIVGAAFNWIYWSDTLVCACVCAEPTTSSAKINNQPQSRRRIAAFSTQIYARDAPPADCHRDCIVIICISALFALRSSCAPSIKHDKFRSQLAFTRHLNSFLLEILDCYFL